MSSASRCRIVWRRAETGYRLPKAKNSSESSGMAVAGQSVQGDDYAKRIRAG